MRSAQVLQLVRAYESRNITAIEPDGSWPIVWQRAQGVHVWDADGKKYLDLTSAFGVAAAGHANPRVVQAGQQQMARLLHAMGDVHPHARKAELAQALSRLTFERWSAKSKVHPSSVADPESTNLGGPLLRRVESPKSKVITKKSQWSVVSGQLQAPTANCQLPLQEFKAQGSSVAPPPIHAKTIFCNSGFEAVEAALKTAMLATGKPGVIAFTGGYHGLGYGAVTTTHRDFFRARFHSQLASFAHFVKFPAEGPGQDSNLAGVEKEIRVLFHNQSIGAVLVEPVQGRGGIRVPPLSFLPLLRRLCDQYKSLLILDEIYTGFGRTGRWFACEHSQTIPDLICLGKALAGGFPLSACVGRADILDAWPASQGEAIHTSTFLGNPVGCAMALAQISEIKRLGLVQRSAALGEFLLEALCKLRSPSSIIPSARGLGLMAGLDLRLRKGAPASSSSLKIIKTMLHRGFILLPEGEHSNVISFTPPLTITETDLEQTLQQLGKQLKKAAL